MDVRVADGLTCRNTIVKADVERIRNEALKQQRTYLPDHIPELRLFGISEFVDAGNVSPGYYECASYTVSPIFRRSNCIELVAISTVL